MSEPPAVFSDLLDGVASSRALQRFLGISQRSEEDANDMQQASEAVSFKQALGVFRRRAALILFCVAVIAGAAIVFSKLQTKKYTATAALAFNNSPLTQEIVGLPANSSGVSLLAQQANELELIKQGDMAGRTAAQLGHGLTEQQVENAISVAGQGESGIITVSATSTSPALSAKIATTYVHQFVEEQKNSSRAFFRSALVLVRKQLASLSPGQRVGADGLQLQNRAQTLSLLSELKADVQVAADAQPPVSPSSPKTTTNASIGVVLGLFIGIALALLLEQADGRIRSPEEFETIYGRRLLGAVPRSKALGSNALLAETEAFNLIRAHLRLSNADRDVHTVMVASAASGDGKTTIAAGLAAAAARSGSRVLLLELDLRDPMLAKLLNLQPGLGLADVLTGSARMDEVTRSIALNTESSTGSALVGTLDVLAAGVALPVTPSGLLEREAMQAVLDHARSAYDLVVIDTPALTAVSDAFPLLTKVDGVIIVGRVEHSLRDTAERLSQVLADSGVRLLGVIANYSKTGWHTAHQRDRQTPHLTVSSNGASSSDELARTATI